MKNERMMYIKLIQAKLLELSNYVQALQENDSDNSELIFEIYAKNLILIADVCEATMESNELINYTDMEIKN